MARRRCIKRRNQTEVELNLAAMLDMAFQLLAFFCLTFKPAPIEGQIQLRLPPPQPVYTASEAAEKPGADLENLNPVQGVNTLTISVFADPNTGTISSLGVGETQVSGLTALESMLQKVFADPGNPFDQVIIQVSAACRYEELMKIVDICTRQVLSDGQKLSKLSFVEIPGD